jgi:hypothetical protein
MSCVAAFAFQKLERDVSNEMSWIEADNDKIRVLSVPKSGHSKESNLKSIILPENIWPGKFLGCLRLAW